MADFSTLGQGQKWVAGSNTNSRGVSVTPSATANTKGSYAQLIAAASNTVEASGVLLSVANASPSVDYLVDLAIGGAGSEVVVAPNLLFSATDLDNGPAQYFIPIQIPSGQRLSARCQAGGASASANHVSVHLVGGGFFPSQGLGRVTAYGPNTADSGAISVDSGGTANTKGSWSQITASTDNPSRYLTLAFGIAQNTLPTTAVWLVDIGVGGAGSETVLISNLPLRLGFSTNSAFGPRVIPPLPCAIPAGTRLAARAQCSITDATDRLFDIAIYGID